MESTTEAVGESKLNGEQVRSLLAVLQAVPDGRRRRGQRYQAATVLAIAVLAKLAGERTVSGVAEWARLRQEWLGKTFGLKRLPCANTYHYIMAHLDVEALNRLVSEWWGEMVAKQAAEKQAAEKQAASKQAASKQAASKQAASKQAAAVEAVDELVHWAIDGKVLRGSHRLSPQAATKSKRRAGLEHGQEVLGVYDVTNRYLHHCQPIISKGYEARAAQDFVAQTDCRGKVITADALHTRRQLCRRIRSQNGHYVLVVKRNRPELEAAIRQLFALKPNPSWPVRTHTTVEAGHGRIVMRRLSTSSELNLALQDQWRDVAQVFLLERWVMHNGQLTYESVCGLTSLPSAAASPAQLLALVQAHWHIENRSHWRRDATLGEDACTVRHSTVAFALALLNALILALFDHLNIANARSAIRRFAAQPDSALHLLLQPL